MPQVIASLSSDWHLSSKAPIARSPEPDWFAAMRRPFIELEQLREQYECPHIFAGDYFHHWNSSAELINWAQQNTIRCYGIPGQHDLPLHNYEDIKKSAYWTMLHTDMIHNLPANYFYEVNDSLILYPFPWGFDPVCGKSGIEKYLDKDFKGVHLAVVHKYVWTAKAVHGGDVTQTSHIREVNSRLKGFDAAVFGDNHIGFQWSSNKVNSLNCGSLMCRNIDQRHYNPRIGLLYEDGTIKSHLLDVSKDKWLERDQIKGLVEKVDLSGLLKEFKKVSANTINFLDVLESTLKSDKVSKDAKECLSQIIEEIK